MDWRNFLEFIQELSVHFSVLVLIIRGLYMSVEFDIVIPINFIIEIS